MHQNLLKELSGLLRKIDTQRELNEKNIYNFFITLEQFIGEIILLKEDVWVDSEIIDNYNYNIFGWNKINSDWHIVIAPRESCNEPDSDNIIIYGGLNQKRIIDCSYEIQKQVFDKSDLLIMEIHDYLRKRYEYLRKSGDDIITKINKIAELLSNKPHLFLQS
jgi:hypothetical protein